MVFNSPQFLVFFLIVTIGFFRLKNQNARVWLLLLASCYFYMTFVPVYILILFFTIAVDYVAGIHIHKSAGQKRKLLLIASIVANLGVLIFYKYFNFLLGNLAPVIGYIVPHCQLPYIDILLPVGLSFHTFQAMSYTIEVYRGNQQPERDPVVYALYVMYYPQLVAGPIERPQNMLHQFHEFRPYDRNRLKEGMARMMWGFFKKVVIADRMALAADYTFGNYTDLSSLSLIVGAIFYSIQIYCDFSGYSDIAIGASKVMGINLMENFNQPYISRSIAEFWTRWHISLFTWFRDYVYIPLGGNRTGAGRRKRNVIVVFLLSGFWHGANWTFIVWGALHGIFTLVLPKRSILSNTVLKGVFQALSTFCLVTICWVFFRASGIREAFTYICRMFALENGEFRIGLNRLEMVFGILLTAIMMLVENRRNTHLIKSESLYYLYMVSMVFVCYFFGVFSEHQFIYFQF